MAEADVQQSTSPNGAPARTGGQKHLNGEPDRVSGTRAAAGRLLPQAAPPFMVEPPTQVSPSGSRQRKSR